MLLPCLLCLVITYQWGCMNSCIIIIVGLQYFLNLHVLLMNIWKTMSFKRPGVQTSVPLDVESVFVYRFCLKLMGRFKSLLGKKTSICLLVIACKENFRQDSSEVRLQWPLCCNDFACSQSGAQLPESHEVSSGCCPLGHPRVTVLWEVTTWELHVTSTSNYTACMYSVLLLWLNKLTG